MTPVTRKIGLLCSGLLLLASTPVVVAQIIEAVRERQAYADLALAVRPLNQPPVVVTSTNVIIAGRSFGRFGEDIVVLNVEEKRRARKRIVVVERRGGEPEKHWTYRVLSYDAKHQVARDTFRFPDRMGRPERTVFARFVSPRPIGFTNSSLQYIPTLFYPVLFPWGTLLAGVLIVLFVSRRRLPLSSKHEFDSDAHG